MSTKKFTAKTFAWLHQVNHDRRYLAIDVNVALQLTVHFNEADNGGRAWPSCKTIGDAIGVSEHSVIRSVQRLHDGGNLYVIPGKPGRGHPNQYWMILKPSPMEVLEDGKPARVQVLETGNVTIKPAPVKIKPAPVQENLLKNHKGAPLGASLMERDRALPRASSPPDGVPLDAAPSGGRKETYKKPLSSEVPTLEKTWVALRAVWQRPHVEHQRSDRDAFRLACQGVAPEVVLEAARAWVAAADAPRFLPPLHKWIDDRGWEKDPPPKRTKRKRHNGHRRSDRDSTSKLFLQEGGAVENEYGDMVYPEGEISS